MVKNTLSSIRYHGVHVKSARKRQRTCQKRKITPWDNNRNHPSIYEPNNMSSIPTWTTGTSGTDLSPKQDKQTSNYTHLPSNSAINLSKISNSTDENTISTTSNAKNNGDYKKYVDQFQRTNLTYKSVLMGIAICLLGLFVIAALIVPNVLLYLMLPVIFQTPLNNTNVTEPIPYANHCGGVSPYIQWNSYSIPPAIFMQIHTNNCSFNTTPLYYTTIIGNSLHTDFSGYNAIYSASNKLFTIYIRALSNWTSTQMLGYAQSEKWDLTWVGIYH